jgi:hypothetical protein
MELVNHSGLFLANKLTTDYAPIDNVAIPLLLTRAVA